MKKILYIVVSFLTFSVKAETHFLCNHYDSDNRFKYVQHYTLTSANEFKVKDSFSWFKPVTETTFRMSGLFGYVEIDVKSLAGRHVLHDITGQIKCEQILMKR